MPEQVKNDIEPRALLVIGMYDVPGCPRCVGCLEHGIACARVVVPAPVGLEIHRRKLPELATICDARLESPSLFLLTDLQPVLEQDDARVHDRSFEIRGHGEEGLDLLLAGKSHDFLDAGTVVPAAIEDHDLAACWQMRNI